MGIQQIRISQQRAQIGIRTSRAGMAIQNPKPQITISNSRPQLTVNSQVPTFRINQQEFRDQVGLKAPLTFTQEFRNDGKQAALRATGQYKSDGNYLANHRVPAKDRTPNLSTNKAMARLQRPETNIGLMPAKIPDLMWDKGRFDINFSKHQLSIDFNGRNTAQVALSPRHSVEIYLQQRAQVRVTGVVEAVPSRGRYVDSSI